MSYTQILYHIVFTTHDREPCLDEANRSRLFEYIWGALKNKDCHLYRVNGVEDHIHLLCSVHPSVSLADLVKDIKVSSTKLIKQESLFPNFSHWQEGYGAFTCSYKDKDAIIQYIQRQEEHHREVSYAEEFETMLKAAGVGYDSKYL